jgi:hypothetical protein
MNARFQSTARYACVCVCVRVRWLRYMRLASSADGCSFICVRILLYVCCVLILEFTEVTADACALAALHAPRLLR